MATKKIYAGVMLIAFVVSPASVAGDNSFDVYLLVRHFHDDNLFRLPDGADPVSSTESPLQRADHINEYAVGASGLWSYSRQKVSLSAQLEDTRYDANTFLNNRGGDGRALWEWALGQDLSGQFSAAYERSLTGFGNIRFFDRDMLTAKVYSGMVRYQLGSYFRLVLSGSHHVSAHSLAIRQYNNANVDTKSAGFEYQSLANGLLGVEYREISGNFPDDRLAVVLRNYKDSTGLFRFKYMMSSKTQLEGNIGYASHRYPLNPGGNFSGQIFGMDISWHVSDKSSLQLHGGRELHATNDAEADYFISTGGTAKFTWQLNPLWQFEPSVSVESRRYQLPGIFSEGLRRDHLRAAQVQAEYSPRDWLKLSLSGRFEKRSSNQELWNYDDHVLGAGVTLVF